MNYQVLLPEATRRQAGCYLEKLRLGQIKAGAFLQGRLAGGALSQLTQETLIGHLLNTKVPRIFAESEVKGNGEDWNLMELRLLGDISIAMPVTVFDNGRHHAPAIHKPPFQASLIFSPGALLRNDHGHEPVDWGEVVGADGTIDEAGFRGLYERRLLPVLQLVNAAAAACGRPALLTMPGLGCGQFAGRFRGKIGTKLQGVLEYLLEKHGSRLRHLKCVYYDPYNECSNYRRTIEGVIFMVRPLLHGNQAKPQLCQPSAYAEGDDDFADCDLYSIVAWDHVSWPGNDFFAGSRSTDDGVKAAATDSMTVLAQIQGRYDQARTAYLPPTPYDCWQNLVEDKKIQLKGTSIGDSFPFQS